MVPVLIFLGNHIQHHIWSHTGHTKVSCPTLIWLSIIPLMILLWHRRFQVYFFVPEAPSNTPHGIETFPHIKTFHGKMAPYIVLI